MRKLAVCLLLLASGTRAQNILSNTDHIVTSATAAITILGGTVGTGGTFVDQTCPTGSTPGVSCFAAGGPTFLSYGALIAASTNGGAVLYANNSATPENKAPYGVLNQSSTGYSLNGLDQTYYGSLAANNQVYVIAFCGIPQAGDYPAVVASTILPSSGQPHVPDGASGCGYGSGIEFSMTPGYKGFATGSPSGTTEAMSAVYSVVKTNHPTWTFGDIKAALRQTADGWTAGWAQLHASPLGYGYGNIDFDAANAVASPAAVFLQAPGMTIANHGYYATITLYPFGQTRRAKEVVYVGGTWPAASAGNELTAAQIATAGGTKVVDTGGAAGVQTFTYTPAATGSATFTALTLDSGGNGSRVESFSQKAQAFVVGTACLN